MFLRSGHNQASTTPHSVPGVDDEIDQDLFHHARINTEGGKVYGSVKLKNNMFANQPMQHRAYALNNFVEVHKALLHDLLAAEHEQLIDQLAGPLRCRADL